MREFLCSGRVCTDEVAQGPVRRRRFVTFWQTCPRFALHVDETIQMSASMGMSWWQSAFMTTHEGGMVLIPCWLGITLAGTR